VGGEKPEDPSNQIDHDARSSRSIRLGVEKLSGGTLEGELARRESFF
jgi:hypothetical protein